VLLEKVGIFLIGIDPRVSRLAENLLYLGPAFRFEDVSLTVRCGAAQENGEKMVGNPLGFANWVARNLVTCLRRRIGKRVATIRLVPPGQKITCSSSEHPVGLQVFVQKLHSSAGLVRIGKVST